MACKEGQFDVVELMVNDQIKTFSINLNAQQVNGMTPFDLALSTVIRYSRVIHHNFIHIRGSFRCTCHLHQATRVFQGSWKCYTRNHGDSLAFFSKC